MCRKEEEGTNGPLQRYFQGLPSVVTALLPTIGKYIASASRRWNISQGRVQQQQQQNSIVPAWQVSSCGMPQNKVPVH